MPRSKSFAKKVVKKIPAGYRQKFVGAVSRVAGNRLVQAIGSDIAAGAAGAASAGVAPGSQYFVAPAAYMGTQAALGGVARWSAKQQQKIKAKR
jgi:hypothetical protein